jgi:UMF1 family MFS transporter
MTWFGNSIQRERVGWYFYDWANSAFSTTVVTVFFGPYLTGLVRSAADTAGFVYPLGIPVTAGSFFPYIVSLSVFFQVLLLPLLGAIADSTRRKKHLLGLSAYTGALATIALYFTAGESYLFAGFLFLVANVSFGAAVVFYNSFLSEISAMSERDAVSSRGWALGYLGGGILLALNLFFFSQAEKFGFTQGEAVRMVLASAGLWWALFTLIPLFTLKQRSWSDKKSLRGSNIFTSGFRQLRQTLAHASRYPQTLLFLAAYLIYSDGIQTVISLASEFGHQELGLPLTTLTQVILMVQFVAFFGALLFGRLAQRQGAKQSLMISLTIWIAALGYAYALLDSVAGFFFLGAIIAIVLGGSQALSRSLYSTMIPQGREAEYFSLYEISERGTSWLGPLLFGLSLQLTQSYRIALLSLVVFFIIGLVLLSRVNVRQAIAEAQSH